jgi:uncharacterized membrane protein
MLTSAKTCVEHPMSPSESAFVLCQICGKTYDVDDVLPAELVREPIARLIERRYPTWGQGYICTADLNLFRDQYVAEIVREDAGAISDLEREVLEAVREHDLLTENTNREIEAQLTLGDRVADHMARFGGSWAFIGAFGALLLFWMALNAWWLREGAFDPYPFILLNLALSTLAALQAPVIIMSQRRQEARDRVRAENEYKVNLKAEIEVRLLGERVDRLLRHQWQRLLEIQQVQVDLMADMARVREGPGRSRGNGG